MNVMMRMTIEKMDGTANQRLNHPGSPGFLMLIVVLLYMGVLFSLTVEGQTVNRKKAQDLIIWSDNMVRAGAWQEGLMHLDNAIAMDPGFSTAYMKKAALLGKLRRTDEAMSLINKALQINPYSMYIYDERAKIKMLALDYKGALNDLTVALSMDPTNQEIRDHKVDDLLALGHYADALNEIDTLISAEYQVLEELEKMALIYLLEDDLGKCSETLFQIFQLTSNSALAYDLKGVLALKENNPKEAHADFSKALSVDPQMVVALHNRAISSRLLGNDEDALADLSKAIEIGQNNAMSLFNRALLHKETGDYNAALKDYDAAIALDDEFEKAIYNRAFTLKLLGNYTDAMMDVDEILFDKPDSPEALNMRGSINFLFGNYNEAINDYTRALDYRPEFAEAQYNRGLSRLSSNLFSDGCQDLKESSELGYERAFKKYQAFCSN